MKVLILSLPTGQGHNQTSNAMKKYLENKGSQCEVLDILEDVSPLLSESVDKGYVWMTSKTPKLYGSMYSAMEKRKRVPSGISNAGRMMSMVTRKKLLQYINDYQPDVIVASHSFAGLALGALQLYDGLDTKAIGIITDFTIHPYWEEINLDYYITASELLNNQANKKGIPNELIRPYGIPVDPKFSKKISKSEARAKLGLPDKLTVLVMGGSMGYGKMVRHIKLLDKLDLDFQIISVCGRNKKVKKQVDSMAWNKLAINYGFTKNVDLLMDAADCIVTKPGGLTMSEALAKKLPAVLVNPIPGQEDRNVEFLLNNGVSMMVSETFPIDEAIYQMFSTEWKRTKMQEILELFAKPDATRDVCELILGMGENDA